MTVNSEKIDFDFGESFCKIQDLLSFCERREFDRTEALLNINKATSKLNEMLSALVKFNSQK